MKSEQATAVENIKATQGRLQRAEAMGTESIWRLLFRFSGPAIVAQVVNASYNLIDGIFAGRLGTAALAALAVSNPLMAIYISIGMGVGVGAASLIARRLGAGNKEGADRAAAGAISTYLIVAFVATAIFLVTQEYLLRAFGASDEVLSLAMDYMLVETWCISLNFLLIVVAELVRVEGNPILSSTASIVAGLLNCVFDPLFAFGWGPFPRLGIAGLAVATTVGRVIGIAILIYYMVSNKSIYRFKLSYFKPDFRIAKEIYRVGISVTLRMIGASISQIIASITAAGFGVMALAAVGVHFRAIGFALTICFGLGQGMLPIVGYNYGAGKKDRAGEAVIKAGATALAWGTICWIVMTLLKTQIMTLFSPDLEFLVIAIPSLQIFAYGFFFSGPQITLGYFFQGIGKGWVSVISATSRQIIFLIPFLLIFPRILNLTGLWVAYPVADFLGFSLTLALLFYEFRRQGIPFRFLKYKTPTEATI
jgi:putative MATE family efflux protein